MAFVGNFDYIPCGCAGSGSPGTPIVQNVIPSPGTRLQPFDVVTFDVIDSSVQLERVIIYISYPNLNIVEAIYTVDGFTPLFIGSSTKTIIPYGFRYQIARQASWPDSLINITVDALDIGGGEN